MKKIILSFIALSMLVCLFSCKAPNEEKSNADNISDNVTQNSANISTEADVPPNDDYDWSRCYIHFETFDEYVDWYKSGKYKSDFYVDKDGKEFKNLLQLGEELQQGERYLYVPYYYGKMPNSRITVALHNVSFLVGCAYVLTPDEAQKGTEKNKLFCEIRLKYLDQKYRNTSDIISAYKSVSPTNSPISIDEKKVRYDGLEREVITTYQSFDDGTTMIDKSFVWEDVMVIISHNDDLGFDLQDFLDGFELRPVDLSAEKIPIE